MKKILYILLIIACGCGVVSCNKTKKETVIDTTDVKGAVDSTLYGICAPKSNIDSLLLAKENGDTMTIYLYSEPIDSFQLPETMIYGGVIRGSKMALTAYKDTEGKMIGLNVINISTMLGRWTNKLDRDFSFEEDGQIKSYTAADVKPFQSWKIRNGKLIIDNTEFTIDELSAKELSIEDSTGIYEFKRH